ncbi:phosphomannomutase/phosphoglucomutase [Pseudomonas sp. HK3]
MHSIAQSIFREYDIRGEYPSQLNERTALLIGQALGSEIIQAGQQQCYVAWDGRLSSPTLRDALVSGICSTGCDVNIIGACPTAVAFWTIKHNGQSCAMITGSHNPKQDNGVKIAVAGSPRSGDDIQVLLSRIKLNLFKTGQGHINDASHLIDDYQQRLIQNLPLKRPLKIVLDAGNGIGGPIASQALKEIGADVIEIACDVDGNFPLHHPDPAKLKNLTWLQTAVKENNADLGIALDGDADRLGVVDHMGQPILPDRLSLLFVEDILKRQGKQTILFDVKCTELLTTYTQQWGGIPKMIATGHTSMKRAIKETNAAFATELSGHILFNDEHGIGVDDGIYAGLRLCHLISEKNISLHERLNVLPNPVATEEIQIPVKEDEKFSIMHILQGSCFKDQEITDIDGLRVRFKQGWVLVRASNTTACLTIRFEVAKPAALSPLIKLTINELHAHVPQLDLSELQNLASTTVAN